MRVTNIALCLSLIPMALFAQSNLSYDVPFSLNEIYQDPDDPMCAIYHNHLQWGDPEFHTWKSPVGDVTFQFLREPGEIPDSAQVIDVPDGYVVYPFYMERNEEETGQFCVMRYNGS